MKLSFLLELLLILIIIAFAASKPINEGNGSSRKVTRVVQNVVQKRQNPVSTSAAPKPTPEDDDDDDDVVDELFDLDDDDEDDESSSGGKQKEKDPSKPQTENLNTNDDDDDDDDEDDILGISEEEETDKDDAPSDEEFDGSEFILFGEDIFQAVFGLEDDEKKKKPAINSTLITSALTHTPANVHLTHTQNKKSKPKPANLEQHKANATHQLNTLDSNKHEKHSSKPSVQLNLQHTPALLELAQSTQSQQNIPTPISVVNKIAENEKTKLENPPPISEDILLNKPAPIPTENDDDVRLEDESNIEEDNDANDNGDFIIVNDKDNFNIPTLPTEDIKNTDEDISVEEEKIQDIKNPDVSENEIPQNDQSDKLIVEPSVATPIQSDILSSSTTKKPKKENDEGLFGIVESIIFDEDDDEDETKPVKSGSNTGGNKDGKPEESAEDENETDDDDDEEDEDEEENSDKISEKPESVSDSTNDINKLKKKKKKQAGFIDTLGETLGLSRTLRRQRTEKVISH